MFPKVIGFTKDTRLSRLDNHPEMLWKNYRQPAASLL
jgi:hypothetical protein